MAVPSSDRRPSRPLPAALVAAVSSWIVLAPVPAAAMCGGNIFMTCPPTARASQHRLRKGAALKRRHPARVSSAGSLR